MPQKEEQIIIIILFLVIIRGLIYGLFIPVDQTPDELHHFRLIKAKQIELESSNNQEREHIAAKIDHAIYYLRYPDIQQERPLSDFPKARLPQALSSNHIYYSLIAWCLKILALEHIRDEIYLVRGISLILGGIVVWLSFLITRELFPNRFLLIGVPTLIMFIPQFSAMNGAINNDKLAEFLVALALLFMLKIFKHGMNIGYMTAFIMVGGACHTQ